MAPRSPGRSGSGRRPFPTAHRAGVRLLIACASLALGVGASALTYEPAASYVGQLPQGLDAPPTVWMLFWHNAVVAAVIAIGGYLSGGLLAVLLTAYNGYLVTEIAHDIAYACGWAEALPSFYHVPTELLGLCLAAAVGLGGLDAVSRYASGRRIRLGARAGELLLTAAALLLISAIIELRHL